MNQLVTTLTPGGQPVAQTLGFTALSAIVANYTSSYLSLPDTGANPVPPWTYGAVIPLPPGIRQASASLLPTVPATPGPPVPQQQASITWTDQNLLADPGRSLQQSQNPRSWDWFVNHQANPTDVNPAVSKAGVPGVTLVVARFSASFIAGTGNSQSAIVGLTETAPPSRVLWGDMIAVEAVANAIDRLDKQDTLLQVTTGVGVQLQIQGITLAAGNFAYLNIAGYNE